MISAFDQLFRRSLFLRPASRKRPSLQSLQRVRSALLLCVEDCDGVQAARLRMQIEAADTAQELWLLRHEAFQVISQLHTQGEAAGRINDLLPLFEGLVAPRQLSRIG